MIIKKLIVKLILMMKCVSFATTLLLNIVSEVGR